MQLKEKINSRNLKEAFKNEDGAIDLASIMVGIIVIGIIGGVVAATVFAVIPWAQDNGAKQQLDNVASAESAYRGLAADTGATAFGAYDGSTALTSTTGATLLAKNISDLKIVAGTNSAGDPCYVASITSASGTKFYATDKTKASKTAPADNCAASTPAAAPLTLSGTTNRTYSDSDFSGASGSPTNVNENYVAKDSNGNVITGATWSIENVTVTNAEPGATHFPNGLKLNTSTGNISGDFSASSEFSQDGTVNFTLKATKGGSVGTLNITYNWSYSL